MENNILIKEEIEFNEKEINSENDLKNHFNLLSIYYKKKLIDKQIFKKHLLTLFDSMAEYIFNRIDTISPDTVLPQLPNEEYSDESINVILNKTSEIKKSYQEIKDIKHHKQNEFRAVKEKIRIQSILEIEKEKKQNEKTILKNQKEQEKEREDENEKTKRDNLLLKFSFLDLSNIEKYCNIQQATTNHLNLLTALYRNNLIDNNTLLQHLRIIYGTDNAQNYIKRAQNIPLNKLPEIPKDLQLQEILNESKIIKELNNK
ncbi:hypothetical protein DICPUDRAFT_73966 [Dictyostelium purpureum]|uniref:Uncharacterized protein n=1 Tax=Dictyostelium purpureum TaxID=5786 RepID=F0Z6D8_DICPU|nr:uncharacterized protein DICPUDRAFT_73966 [Dictyostelium purpureum]EGC40426.1 hypothetical protein DICPUDRAFT_73966 [Dictyostelium purpureum]|eukprot:XP_003282973.1 hypothetical protein DICPUDRAFT_73966 [Dictyostelium purpureum]